jgi:hypothetical protein
VAALVIVVVAGVGVAVGVRGTPAPVGAAPTPSALVGAPDAESSAWYCTGQSTAGGVSPGALVLTNTTSRAVTADIAITSDSGATAKTSAAVPAHGVVAPSLPAPSAGAWESDTVVTAGGGLAVSQTIDGPLGWSQSPCQSTTAATWYFAGGSTSAANSLYVSLLNPTSTPVVVDLSFVTPSGMVHPINYQGLVLPAGQIAVENVTSEVQDIPDVSTIVATRTGRVVASEVQQIVGPGGTSGGMSLVPGVVAPQSHWAIPQAQEVTGGTSEIDVFNPGTETETVTVQVRLASGPLSPLTDKILPGTTWNLQTSAQTRIPVNVTYSTTIDATGGSGVVVGRSVGLPSAATPPPQAGVAVAVDGLSAGAPSGEWVVPPPGTSANPAVSGAIPAYLALFNTSDHSETYNAVATTASGNRVVATGTLAARASIQVYGSPLDTGDLAPIVVHSSGPMAVSEDVHPSAGLGVVSMPGIPLAPPISD